jgi:hypothetical protein
MFSSQLIFTASYFCKDGRLVYYKTTVLASSSKPLRNRRICELPIWKAIRYLEGLYRYYLDLESRAQCHSLCVVAWHIDCGVNLGHYEATLRALSILPY